jgi:hypothetical protein
MSKYIKVNVLYLFLIFLIACLGFVLIRVPKNECVETIECMEVNVETQRVYQPYTQIGVLTCKNDIILPLMGRRIMRNKWQYYAISNTGTINSRLPMTFSGKSCSSEYGCDELTNKDMVHVDGYKYTFYVTLYDNEKLHYIPYA